MTHPLLQDLDRYTSVIAHCTERDPEIMAFYEELAQAIILQAVKDYRKVLKMLGRRPDSFLWLKEKRSCEAFFHSSWFSVLTGVDPDQILDGLRKEAAV